MLFVYPARIEERERTILVSFRDFPEAVSEAPTRGEALEAARAVLDAAIQFRTRDGRELPEASPEEPGEIRVGASPTVAAKAVLAIAMRRAGETNLALATRLELSETEIRRMLDFGHGTKIDRLDEVLHRGYGVRLWLGAADLRPRQDAA